MMHLQQNDEFFHNIITFYATTEFYTELFDCQECAVIHTDRNEIPEITSWEVEAALRDTRNWGATDSNHINIETLKTEEGTILKTFAKLYTKC